MKEVMESVQVVSFWEAVGANRAEAIVALVVHMESTGVNLSGENITVKKYLNLTFVEHQVVPAGWPPYIQSAQELWVTLNRVAIVQSYKGLSTNDVAANNNQWLLNKMTEDDNEGLRVIRKNDK